MKQKTLSPETIARDQAAEAYYARLQSAFPGLSKHAARTLRGQGIYSAAELVALVEQNGLYQVDDIYVLGGPELRLWDGAGVRTWQEYLDLLTRLGCDWRAHVKGQYHRRHCGTHWDETTDRYVNNPLPEGSLPLLPTKWDHGCRERAGTEDYWLVPVTGMRVVVNRVDRLLTALQAQEPDVCEQVHELVQLLQQMPWKLQE